MRLPDALQGAIDEIVESSSSKALGKAREAMTQGYREGAVSPFDVEAGRLVYLAARMPATFAACLEVLSKAKGFSPKKIVDLGAGPGTASWAAAEVFGSIEEMVLLERSSNAISLGKRLAGKAEAKALREAHWVQANLQTGLPAPIPKVDLLIASYLLNEMKGVAELVKDSWEAAQICVFIEPGTPKGAATIRKVRQQLIDLGAFLVAPCPHSLACPSDWCHFSARLERSRLHRQIKGGSLGYEDEKFSYVIAAKEQVAMCQNRILRHPAKRSGHVQLQLCAKSGQLEEIVVTKKDKEFYRAARDAEWGDAWPPQM